MFELYCDRLKVEFYVLDCSRRKLLDSEIKSYVNCSSNKEIGSYNWLHPYSNPSYIRVEAEALTVVFHYPRLELGPELFPFVNGGLNLHSQIYFPGIIE